MGFRFLGTGSAAPARILTNDDLSAMVETSDEWITTRVGVRERRIAVEETTASLAAEAARRALEQSGVSPEELDLILCATITADDVCPTVAGAVQEALGASCPAFDISSACSGFLFALETAAGFFARGTVKKALVIGAERISKILDWSDRSTCVIFGDGAGAAVLGASEEDSYLVSELHTAGGSDVIHIPAYQGQSPFRKVPEGERPPVIFMAGQETFKFAVNAMVNHIRSMAEKIGKTPEELDFVVPHQANTRIIDFAAKKLNLPPEKFIVTIQNYGNTAAASVPTALDEANRSGRIKRGDLVAMVAFGGGLSSAGAIVRW
ncbi:MAG: ketoacyl-ACP synthase III [Ruminococcaceae bacterium]|jgi:3-oxoacyl-[acyl-carrier-protein] synthase-3|nr:ketoacyl-ACP synthase III [Oscillospiraceae bacterium]